VPLQFLTLVLATFVLEDAAAIAAGVLAADGRVSLPFAVTACAVGIWIGDLVLFALGRFGGAALLRTGIGRRLATRDAARAGAALKQHAGLAIVGSRFVPGTRLPIYVGAGLAGLSAPVFAAWTALGCLVWTPILVATIAIVGRAVADPLQVYLGGAWIALPVCLSIAWLLRGRVRSLRVTLARLRRWEFWPQWLFYAPVVPWVVWLIARHGARAIGAANPGLEDGGFTGESKSAILEKLPREWTLPHIVVAAGESLPGDVAFPVILNLMSDSVAPACCWRVRARKPRRIFPLRHRLSSRRSTMPAPTRLACSTSGGRTNRRDGFSRSPKSAFRFSSAMASTRWRS
jgi:membrane protein DedA with SNARE-associated domain